tara:strand:- start:1470 stop:2594 length:1125 start_codon:yes stop_codon:yes gene_type:complete
MYNGQPVKGNKGSCPMNSTWVEPEAPAPVDDRNILQKAGGWIKENPLEAASYGLMFGGPVGWGIRGGMAGVKALRAGGLMNSRTGKLMDRLFRKEGVPANPGFVLPKGVSTQSRNQAVRGGVSQQTVNTTPLTGGASAASRVMKRPSALALAGTAGAGAGMYGLNYAGKDDRLAAQQALQTQQQQQASTAMDANTKALMDANATKAEADRVANLNPMERIMENLKKPGFLTDPLIEGGPAGYNRLSKLGVLMDYYGSTPKQRATKTSPNEQFASIEKDVLANQTALAKAQQTLSSPFGKPNVNTLADSLMNKVKAEFGDTWLTFGAKDDQLEPIAKAIAIRITQLTAQYPQSDPKAIEEEAFKQIEEEGWKSVA